MHENESDLPNTELITQIKEQPAAYDKTAGNSHPSSFSIPKPVFIRLMMLFSGGAGCLFVGIVVALAIGDLVVLAMSVILCTAFAVKGILLKNKIKSGQIFCVSGVCVNIIPKLLNRYRRIELVNTDTGDDAYFILSNKTVFKIGHVYKCYFDNHISNRPVSINSSKGGFFNGDFDLPTNGFLGFEDFGVYQEKPFVVTTAAAETDSTSNNAAGVITETPQNTMNREEKL